MKKLFAANWKMNKTVKESVSFIHNFKKLVKKNNNEIVICPPFTSLSKVKKLLKNTNIKLGAQNMHHEEKGAFTGEISALMIKDSGCEYVILGHSDRRHIFNESDEVISKKIKKALEHKLKVIFCVGETFEEREKNKTNEVLKNQLEKGLKDISEKELQNVIIAYEPVWAISRGNSDQKPATKEDAENAHNIIRNFLASGYGNEASKKTRIIYGGSMKPDNAKELTAMPNIDGGLVGNASLEEKSFAEICNN